MRRFLLSLGLAGALAALSVATAAAESKPANPNCWGVVVSQRAISEGDIGEHAAAQDEPRLGLGNFARLLFDLGFSAGPHISDAATVAAALDGLESTNCPLERV